jgi:Icc-related predicted phosphoesterase
MAQDLVRIAAMSDLHYGRADNQQLLPALTQAAAAADVVVLCGDLTDHGLPEEARGLAKNLASFKVPIVAVLGNHDYESGRVDEVTDILSSARIRMLDGDAAEVRGVGFAGTKGFCGGFGPRALGSWGESAIKSFVREAVDEALKLETALAKLRTEHRVVLLHYAPIRETVEGEPKEIYPFLGSSRLEDPINRSNASVVFHGHAHKGAPEGRTLGGVPVYNVSMPLLGRQFPDRPPYHVEELPVGEPAESAGRPR